MPSNHSKALMTGGGGGGGGGGRARGAGNKARGGQGQRAQGQAQAGPKCAGVGSAGDSASDLTAALKTRDMTAALEAGAADWEAAAFGGGGGGRGGRNARKKKKGQAASGGAQSGGAASHPAPGGGGPGGGQRARKASSSSTEPGLRGDARSRASSAASSTRDSGGGGWRRRTQQQQHDGIRPQSPRPTARKISSSALSPDAKPFVASPSPGGGARPIILSRSLQQKEPFRPGFDREGQLAALATAKRDLNNNKPLVEDRQSSDVASSEESQQDSPEPHPAPTPSLKHPLSYSWTLWYFANDGRQEWEDNLKQVSTFRTVEDFWALYHHIASVSELRSGCDYSLFRQVKKIPSFPNVISITYFFK